MNCGKTLRTTTFSYCALSTAMRRASYTLTLNRKGSSAISTAALGKCHGDWQPYTIRTSLPFSGASRTSHLTITSGELCQGPDPLWGHIRAQFLADLELIASTPTMAVDRRASPTHRRRSAADKTWMGAVPCGARIFSLYISTT